VNWAAFFAFILACAGSAAWIAGLILPAYWLDQHTRFSGAWWAFPYAVLSVATLVGILTS
jgi:hypothetical protein